MPTFTLDAGVGNAGKGFLIFSGVTGSYPGFTMKGVSVPLNLDAWTWTAFSLINSSIMQNFMGAFDGAGQATAIFVAPGPLPPEAIGLPMYFDYLVLKKPGQLSPIAASVPIFVFFIP